MGVDRDPHGQGCEVGRDEDMVQAQDWKIGKEGRPGITGLRNGMLDIAQMRDDLAVDGRPHAGIEIAAEDERLNRAERTDPLFSEQRLDLMPSVLKIKAQMRVDQVN